MSNTAPSRADPVVVFLLADGTHHKKPHSPTHPTVRKRESLGTDWETDWWVSPVFPLVTLQLSGFAPNHQSYRVLIIGPWEIWLKFYLGNFQAQKI